MPNDWDDTYDDEDFDTGWADDDAEALTAPCPECGADVYEDAEQCPACGHWITDSSRSRRYLAEKPLWYLVLAGLGIVAVVFVLSGLASLL